jgi:hypothetical protein
MKVWTTTHGFEPFAIIGCANGISILTIVWTTWGARTATGTGTLIYQEHQTFVRVTLSNPVRQTGRLVWGTIVAQSIYRSTGAPLPTGITFREALPTWGMP